MKAKLVISEDILVYNPQFDFESRTWTLDTTPGCGSCLYRYECKPDRNLCKDMSNFSPDPDKVWYLPGGLVRRHGRLKQEYYEAGQEVRHLLQNRGWRGHWSFQGRDEDDTG